MPTEAVSTVVGLLVALSVASERLVEIVKGLIPALDKEQTGKKEGYRRAGLHALAAVSGIVTALLARPAIETVVPGGWNTLPGIFALGLLASGGSGFWNGVLSYIYQAKNLKKAEVKRQNGGALKV